MNYTITDNILLPQLIKKISEVAARAYSPEGTPLYDAIVPVERDNSTLIGYCVEALRTLTDRFKGDAYLSDNYPEGVTITITIPTFDSTREASAQSAIEQYIIYTAVAKYLDERYPQGAKSYADRAAVMIDEVVRYMYQRLRPMARR